jgi:hypothetical protein
MAKKSFSVLILFLVVGFITNCKSDSLVGSTWVNKDNGFSLHFSSETQVVLTIGGYEVPAIYSVVDDTVTISAMLDRIVGKIEGNKITIISGSFDEGDIFTKK